MAKVTFNNKDSVFFDALKTKVEQYFIENNIRTTGNLNLYIKTFTLIPAALAIYLLLLFVHLNPVVALLFCALLGFTCSSIGFNVMHDACHGSYSSKRWVNNLLGLSINCLGGNAFIWKFKHNLIHHTYTNIDGIDDDIRKVPVIRQCESQKKLKFHRYQHLYSVLVYALSSFLWVFFLDFVKYFKRKVIDIPMNNLNAREHVIFWSSKLLYIVFYVAIPVYFVGLIPWLVGFSVLHLVEGFTLAMVFQLAHVVEDTHFIDANHHVQKINQEWAIHQVSTTADFATGNKIISWFAGGLNFQVEHHLFPKISHIHYPAISRFVKECCDEYEIQYIHYPTLLAAVASHFRFMKHLARN
jgi:linoleoyl-CoA desaturase